jgi:NAD(P)-dependent dehydrogenase (short-subunit alcohol dehydrogenase family)
MIPFRVGYILLEKLLSNLSVHVARQQPVECVFDSRAAFPHLQEAGDGVIINFARAGQPQANMVSYNCAKAGIEALTRTLALEGRDLGIRVNAIAPGLVDTASNIAAMKPKDLKRWTKRGDIAETVLFLASPAAKGITGQTLAVTGWGL